MQYWDSASNIFDKTDVLYVGKAKNLRERIKRYWKFGEGKPVAHWGGRYIGQIKYSKNFYWLGRKRKMTQEPESLKASYWHNSKGIWMFAFREFKAITLWTLESCGRLLD